MMSLPVWLPGPMFILGGLSLGGLYPGGCLWKGSYLCERGQIPHGNDI